MAVSDSFLTYVLDQLGDVRRFVSKRMFGGIGLYADDTFFGVIDNDTIFFKVDDSTVVRYQAMKMPPFNPMPEKGPMLGYYQVPAVVLEDRSALLEWAAEAIAVGQAVVRRPARKKTAGKRAAPAEPTSKKAPPKKPAPKRTAAVRARQRSGPRKA